MFDDIISNILQLKLFIITAASGALLTGISLLVICRKFEWNARNRKFIGFLYGLSVRDTVSVAMALLKFFLLVSVVISGGNASFICVCVFLVLEAGYLVNRKSCKGLITDIVLGAITVCALVVMNMLYSYLHEIIYDGRILMVVILLGILLSIYALCDVFHCCTYIMIRGRKKIQNEDI